MAETNASKAAREAKQNDPTIEQHTGEVVAVSEGIQPDLTRGTDDGLVAVKLAHPLTKQSDFVFLGLAPGTKAGVNDEVRVTRAGARALIDAGMAQIDPEDNDAVRSLLTKKK